MEASDSPPRSGGPPRPSLALARPSRAPARASRPRPRPMAEAANPSPHRGVAPPMDTAALAEPEFSPAMTAALLQRVAALEALSATRPSPTEGRSSPPSPGPTSSRQGDPSSSSHQPAPASDWAPTMFQGLGWPHRSSEPVNMGHREYGQNSTTPDSRHQGLPIQPNFQWPWPSFNTSTAPSVGQPLPHYSFGHCNCHPWFPFGPPGCHQGQQPPTPHVSFGPSLPLGDHLLQSTRDKIINGEYVDLFSLLNRDSYPTDLSKLDELDKERARRKKPPRTWENWLPAFIIYAGVLVRARPDMALPLFHYLDIIYRAHVDFPGDAWKFYDEEFRMRVALRPGMRWDEPNPALWLQYMTPSRPAAGDRFDCGHLVQHPPEQHPTTRAANSSISPRTFCWEFAAHGRCNKKQCRYKHECLVCSGPHGASACPSAATRPPPGPSASSRPPSASPPNPTTNQ